jgi:hypothetical protein
LVTVLVAEIVLTMADFIVEISVRKPLGDVYGGERLTHAAMGILYGAMLANLYPTLREWAVRPTALKWAPRIPRPCSDGASREWRWGSSYQGCVIYTRL